jgi:hypothetical protein
VKSLLRLDAALRFWKSRYDALAMELDQLMNSHRTLERARIEHKERTVEQHRNTVGAGNAPGESLLALHRNLVAHGRYDQRTALQQHALTDRIVAKRDEMAALKRKLRQVETIKAGAERSAATATNRRLEEDAAYLFLIRNRVAE